MVETKQVTGSKRQKLLVRKKWYIVTQNYNFLETKR